MGSIDAIFWISVSLHDIGKARSVNVIAIARHATQLTMDVIGVSSFHPGYNVGIHVAAILPW